MIERQLILVTGGGGFLGRHIVRALQAEDNFAVRVFGQREHPDLAADGIEVHCGDIRDAAAVRAACQGVDGIIHTAGIAGAGPDRKPYFDTNVRGTRNLLQACEDQGVPRLVFTSSPSVVSAWGNIVDGDESLPYPRCFPASYPRSKAIAEQDVIAAASNTLATCALRPHLIWGPGDCHLIPHIVDLARRNRLVRIGDGANQVSLTHVRNAAKAHLQALEALTTDSPLNGRVYFIADSAPVVLWDWIDELLTALDLPPTRRSLPLPAAKFIGGVLDTIRRLAPSLGGPNMSRFLAIQLGTSHCFLTQRAERDFGYAPIVENAHGKKELVECLKTTVIPRLETNTR